MEASTSTVTAVIVSNSSVMHGHEETSEEEEARMTLKIALSCAYILLFVAGTIGNAVVIAMIVNILTSMKNTSHRLKKHSLSNTNHVFIYVLGLSIVDLLVILHLPFLVFDLLKGEWVFGHFMCKAYWFGESVNKLLSSFVMTVLSWDRFLAVCSPVSSIRIRSNGVALTVLLICTLLAIFLLIPVLTEATVVKIDKIRMIPLEEESPELRLSDEEGSTVRKCLFEAGTFFTVYTFLIGFLIPAFLITLFYTGVIYRLHKNSQNIRLRMNKDHHRRDDRIQKVTKRIIAVILFYYCCWLPQTTLNIMTHFNLIQVCFNSAANPVLYALINRELRQQHLLAMSKKRQSISQATGDVIEFVAKTTHNLTGLKSNLFASTRRRSVPPIRSANRTVSSNKLQLRSATPSPRTSVNDITTTENNVS
ncbi:hypothetical protein WR25_16709 [Diploscapter pachys]|uniref:G-protein coupled receptors family 1 profile domain-containing protein n=1 Tax=Diploscapter pachys TaxID=2018661 RepID=A0A2A2LU21_9BILA|nr:hypothetical protein WR25_16709 [Diploscapter pachys]